MGINPVDIARSSLAYWELFGNSRNSDNNLRIFDFLHADPGSPLADSLARGFFNIPLCYDPAGYFISSLNSETGKAYPCACQAGPSEAANRMPLPGGLTQRMAQFLEATHLRFSYDFHAQCFGDGVGRQNCAHIDALGWLETWYTYPMPDLRIDLNLCWQKNDGGTEESKGWNQCLPIKAYDKCRPGSSFGWTNIEGPPPYAPPPKNRGYGLHGND